MVFSEKLRFFKYLTSLWKAQDKASYENSTCWQAAFCVSKTSLQGWCQQTILQEWCQQQVSTRMMSLKRLHYEKQCGIIRLHDLRNPTPWRHENEIIKETSSREQCHVIRLHGINLSRNAMPRQQQVLTSSWKIVPCHQDSWNKSLAKYHAK